MDEIGWAIFVWSTLVWAIYKTFQTKNKRLLLGGAVLVIGSLAGWPFHLPNTISMALIGLLFAGSCTYDFCKTKNRDFALYAIMFLILGAAIGVPALIKLS